MRLIQRIGYYLGGFAVGLIILAFFFNGKKTSCSYGAHARVLKDIRLKKLVYADGIPSDLNNYDMDSMAVNYVLKKGRINFSKSNVREKPCGMYYIEGDFDKKEVIIVVKNCDSMATVTEFRINQIE